MLSGCNPIFKNQELEVNAIIYQNSFNSTLYYELLDGTAGGFLENNLHVTHSNGHLFWPDPLFPDYQLGTIDDGPEQRLALHSFFGASSKTIYPHVGRVISSDLTKVAYQEGEEIVVEIINPKKEGKVLETSRFKTSIKGRIQFFSPTGRYLYFKTNIIPGSTPFGDEALLDLTNGQEIIIDVEDYFHKPEPSPKEDKFVVARQPGIISVGQIVEDGYKLWLYTLATKTWELLDYNSEQPYGNISWHDQGEMFIYQKSPYYPVEISNSPQVDYYCNTGIHSYDLTSKKIKTLLPESDEECLFLLGFPSHSDTFFFISKNIKDNKYAIESMDLGGSDRKVLTESSKPIDFFAFVHVPE